jgi:hypothetical protein
MNLQHLAASLRQLQPEDDVKLARGMAHIAFDRLWKSGHMTRSQAYAWLAYRMGMSKEQAHIANFSVEQCRYVEKITKHFLPHLYP